MSLLKTVNGVTSDIIEKHEWKEYAPDIPNDVEVIERGIENGSLLDSSSY